MSKLHSRDREQMLLNANELHTKRQANCTPMPSKLHARTKLIAHVRQSAQQRQPDQSAPADACPCFSLRRESPFRVSLRLLWISRSRMASAIAGSLM